MRFSTLAGIAAAFVIVLQATPAHAQRQSARQTYEAMAAAMDSYHPVHPLAGMAITLEPAADEASTTLSRSALAYGGANYQGREALSLIMAIRGWFAPRATRADPGDLNRFNARLQALAPDALDVWEARLDALGNLSPEQDVLQAMALVFLDPLWEGATMAPGQPDKYLGRLATLTPEAVTQWAEQSGMSETPFVAAYALIVVDALFVDNVFQPSRFEAALAAAPAQ